MRLFNHRIISSLHSPAYRIYFLGTLGFFAAMSMNMVASPKLIYQLTDSTALLGTMSLIAAVPILFMSLFAGAIADRLQKKWIIFGSMLGFAAMALLIALALETGMLSREKTGSWWILLVASFVQGNLMGMLIPALQAILPDIVRKEQMMNAIAVNILGMNILSLIVPTLAGLVIDNSDYKYVFYAMSGLYIYAAAFTYFIPRSGSMSPRGGKILDDIRNGIRYVRQDATIRALLIFTTGIVVLSMPFQQFLPVFTDKILNVGATGLGALMSVSGGGALAGSLMLAARPGKSRGRLLLAGSLMAGLALIIFAFSRLWGLSLLMMVFIGVAQTVRNTMGSALLQAYAAPQYLGRVMSVANMQWGVMALTTFAVGLVAELTPVQWVVAALALALVVITVWSWVFGASLKKLE